MEIKDFEKLQELAYFHAAKQLNHHRLLTKQITLCYLKQTVESDLLELQSKNLLVWDVNLKGSPYTSGVHDTQAIIKGAMYYGNAADGRYCVGYFIGSYNSTNESIEIDYIEKRCDKQEELENKFLGIVITTLSVLAEVLASESGKNVTQIAFVSPLEEVIELYKSHGFERVENYRNSQLAMIRYKSKGN